MSSFKVGEAPWEKSPKKANSARPSDLESPVPQASAPAPEAVDLSGFKVGEAPWETEAPAESALPGPDQFAEEPGFVRANIEQFNPRNLVDRITTGLAANDTEKTSFLQKKYGKENVANQNGKIYFRRNAEDKLKPLDPATLELISDIIPDFAREIVTEGTMLPGEIAGAAMGAAAGAPTGPGAAVTAGAGALMGRVVSVPLANKVADSVAQGMGIPLDESRNQYVENAIGIGAEATLPVVGKYAAKAIAKRIPGTLAYKAAREAGEKEVVALTNQSQEILQASNALEAEGIKIGMTLEQLQPGSPVIKKLADKASRDGESGAFLNAQEKFNKDYESALITTVNDIKQMVNPNGPLPGGKIAKSISSAIEGLDEAEGKAIGQFRASAMATLSNQKQQLPPETSQKAIEAMKLLGFQPKRVKLNSVTKVGSVQSLERRGALTNKNVIERIQWTPPRNLDPIAGRLGLTDVGQTRAVVNVLNEYGQLVSRGNEARFSDVERIINRMAPLHKKLQGTQAGAVIGKITGDLRQHRRGMIESTLSDDMDKKLFNSLMNDFSMRRANVDTLSGVLDKDMSAKSVARYFFGESADKERVTVLKSLLGEDSHQFGALKEEYINQQMIEFGSKAGSPTRFNSEGFLKSLTKNEVINKEIMNTKTGLNYEKLKNVLTIGQRIESVQRGIKADSASDDVKKGLINIVIGYATGFTSRMANGGASILGLKTGEEKAFAEIINRDGFEKYLAGYKGKVNKADIARTLENWMSQYNAGRVAVKQIKALSDVGKDITKRGSRAYVKEEMMDKAR